MPLTRPRDRGSRRVRVEPPDRDAVDAFGTKSTSCWRRRELRRRGSGAGGSHITDTVVGPGARPVLREGRPDPTTAECAASNSSPMSKKNSSCPRQ